MQYLAMRTLFQSLLNRTDCPDTLAKTFFQQAIQKLNRDLRIPSMEEIMVINTTNGNVASTPIPQDYLETIAFLVTDPNGESYELQAMDLGNFARVSNYVLSRATYYARLGSNWNIAAAISQGASAQVVYYGELTPLVNDTDEPALALIAPDLIIYTALGYAGDYFIDDRRTEWKNESNALKDLVQGQASDGDFRTGTDAIGPAYELNDGIEF